MSRDTCPGRMPANAVHYERVIRAVLLAGAIVAVVVVQLMRRRGR